ncbi:MAG TPA: hypothetical protein VMU45_13490 [Candidatus Eisenbacteria bacterium]|nr:hypothetical protein [Candidatus Eisenbacteria bacterium]
MRIAFIATLVLASVGSGSAQNYPSATPTAPGTATQTAADWPTSQFAATAAKDPSVRKARQVLDDMIRALGGDAYLNVREMSVEGRTYAFYHGRPSGLGVLFWRFWQWPDKDRYELTKQRDIIDLFVGDKGYETTYKGTAALDPKQLTDYLRRREHSLDWVIRQWLAAPGTMILYEGTAIVEQNLADKVTILTAANDSVTIAVDPRTHLPVKKTYSYRDPIDRQFDTEDEIFSNYKVVQGIATPYSTVRMENGEMSNQRFINNVGYNAGLDAAMFEPKGLLYNQPKANVTKPQ